MEHESFTNLQFNHHWRALFDHDWEYVLAFTILRNQCPLQDTREVKKKSDFVSRTLYCNSEELTTNKCHDKTFMAQELVLCCAMSARQRM